MVPMITLPPSPDLNTHIWTLVGLSEDKDGIPAHLVVHDTRHLIIYVHLRNWIDGKLWRGPRDVESLSRILRQEKKLSPALAHPLTLYARADHFVLRSAVIHGLTNSDQSIYEMYDQFGPISRICFNFFSNEALLIRHKVKIERRSNIFHLETGSQEESHPNVDVSDGKGFSIGSSELIHIPSSWSLKIDSERSEEHTSELQSQ